MDRLLSEGQFPPRWSGELNNGYGYPLFLFNYPLPAMVGEIFHHLGLGFVDSVKMVFLLSMLGSVVGMYLFLRALFRGNNLGAFLGSLFYLYAPVRFSTVYVSAAVGAALGLGIVPFVFWSLYRIYQTNQLGYILIGSLSLAALILSHNVTTLIFAPAILGFSLLLIYQSEDRIKLIRNISLTIFLGLMLSAWFWLPALLEKQYTFYDLVMKRFYTNHFPAPWQLIRSPWGYGLSHPGDQEDGLSFQIGLIHLGVILLLASLLWFYRRYQDFLWWGRFCLILFLLSVFLMLEVSVWFWDRVPLLGYVQFPARFLSLAIFSAAIASALLVRYLPFRKLVFVILLGLVIYANRNHWNINQVFDPGEEYYLSLKTTSTAWGEHLPRTGKIADRKASGKFEFISGGGQISLKENKSAKVIAAVESSTSAQLRFNQFYFPGWEIKIDGKPVRSSDNLPQFHLEKGRREVVAEFTNTPVRNMADGLSVVGVGVWLGFGVLNMLKLRR